MSRDSKLLRTDLPVEVWERLNAEAAQRGMTIGVFVKRLIIDRDARVQVSRRDTGVSGNQERK